MKYLKRFNESHTDIIQNVKDILLPISDMGYDISVTEDNPELIIRVVSWGDKPLLITGDVKEEFIRMRDYLQSEGYNSIEAKFYLENRGQDETPYRNYLVDSRLKGEKDIDDFINIEYPISNLLFVAKKKL